MPTNMTGIEARGFLDGGGVCGELVRMTNWEKTPLGPVVAWPVALKSAVGVVLHSRQPMFIWWGSELIQLYNDAYVPSFGAGKHPAAMGQRGEECWEEIWPIIKPQIDDVMERGKPSWNVDHLVPIWRNGHTEEVYWTYGYSPIYADDGSIGGTLVVCTETTASVIARRRLEFLRRLALKLLAANDASDVLMLLQQIIPEAALDIPFAAIRAAGEQLACVGLDGADAAALDGYARPQTRRAERFTLDRSVVAGPWPEPVTEVLSILLEPEGDLSLQFGLSARLSFDSEYQGFLEQLSDAVLTHIARARTQVERRGLLEQAPVPAALILGPQHVFEIANPRYCEMVGRNVVGKPYLAAFPELRDSELPGILDRVYERGEPFVTSEMRIPLATSEGEITDRFFNFNLEPVRSATGGVIGMMAIATDMTEQVVARQILEQANRERTSLLADAHAAGRAKDEFLAMLGHELRNPLAPILTALELMEITSPDALKRERSIIGSQARHLIHLVDDLLDVARVAQGKIELKRTRIKLSDVVERAVETSSPLFEDKTHQLHVDVPTDGLDIEADATRLRQVVSNLLTNAARYTPPGGRISILGRLEGEDVVLRVKDNGIGIADDQLPHLFDLFFQGPRRNDRAEGGLGLGLALVKTFVTLHGGTVRAQSAGAGRGSSFEVRLPVAAPESQAANVQIARPPSKGLPLRVLVVDDNRDLAELLCSLLQHAGLQVQTALDGLSGLEMAREHRPEVAIVDIGLPVLDGYELAQRLREALGTQIGLIAMTGYGQPENRERSRASGFDVHLVKPVDSTTLLKAIDDLRPKARSPDP